ncbi:SBP (S-ribonuclease binding protein) family protein [Rhynchospora pubera]|uniref:SBP (S-ribonuclease binding protein) family protein n=1 Tax=Rhynchospora pubera TaxID=906938 RepID=A0AAV8F088_9POAL|nr:SBP (S-ribonuclease binding protein) family protein [Rhynchospora pubera]
MDFHFQQPPSAFFSNAEIINHHKRRKEMEAPPLESCSPSLFISSLLSDLAPQIKQQRDQIDRFLHDHCERLRRALTETQRRHHVALLGSAESLTARRLREKESELDRAVRRGAELEDRISNLKSELMTWQSKALSYQSTAASLHARLQQAAAAQAQQPGPSDEPVTNPAEDAESGYIDPDRVEPSGPIRLCKVCRARTVSVVLLPCRHLCLCDCCDVAAACDGACPLCHCVSTGCVQVFFS